MGMKLSNSHFAACSTSFFDNRKKGVQVCNRRCANSSRYETPPIRSARYNPPVAYSKCENILVFK